LAFNPTRWREKLVWWARHARWPKGLGHLPPYRTSAAQGAGNDHHLAAAGGRHPHVVPAPEPLWLHRKELRKLSVVYIEKAVASTSNRYIIQCRAARKAWEEPSDDEDNFVIVRDTTGSKQKTPAQTLAVCSATCQQSSKAFSLQPPHRGSSAAPEVCAEVVMRALLLAGDGEHAWSQLDGHSALEWAPVTLFGVGSPPAAPSHLRAHRSDGLQLALRNCPAAACCLVPVLRRCVGSRDEGGQRHQQRGPKPLSVARGGGRLAAGPAASRYDHAGAGHQLQHDCAARLQHAAHCGTQPRAVSPAAAAATIPFYVFAFKSALPGVTRQPRLPVAKAVGGGKDAYFFEFGVIILFGLEPAAEQAVLTRFGAACQRKPYVLKEVEMDQFHFVYSATEPPHIKNDMFTINKRQANNHQASATRGGVSLGQPHVPAPDPQESSSWG
ncbi:DUF155 domain-containing protein, partial [Haematococcus lacustris]